MRPQMYKIRDTSELRLPKAWSTIFALMLREMATSYGRSPGGYVWAIAEPLAGIALLTFIFSLGFQAPPLGSSFALFYASGLVPFLVYSDISGKVAQSINYSLPLLSYPRVTIADAVLARALLNSATQILVVALVTSGLLFFIGTRSRIDPAPIVAAIALALLLGFSIGCLNCFLVTRFPVWQRVWSILNRPMFLLSCVVFTFESIPRPFDTILWFNPIVHIVGLMRQGLYLSYDATYVSIGYVMLIVGITSASGLFLLWRFRNLLLNRA